MMLTEIPRPAIIAHRGASFYAPENTLAAFKMALQQGADGIELDAKLSADGQVVVIHDPTVDRTTPSTGRVKNLRLSDLRRMDAGSHFDIAFQGELIPTLEEVFRAVGQLTFINIELTNYTSLTDKLPEKVADLVRQYRLQQRVLFSSFSPIALVSIRRQIPEAPIGLLATPGRSGILARSWLGRLCRYQSLHVEAKDATVELIQRAHRHGKRVFVYTVDDEDTMRRLFELSIDGIITDNPILALNILKSVKTRTSASRKEIRR